MDLFRISCFGFETTPCRLFIRSAFILCFAATYGAAGVWQRISDKPIGPEGDYAESWEICDRGRDQSVVAGGPLAGATLAELVAARGADLFGRHHPQARFPLLMKFLDAARDLSVQVHPNDAQAARLRPPDAGKTEAWVVLAAEPGSTIYAGLASGVDRQTLAAAIAQGTCQELLHRFLPAVGDCVFLPAGTVHALGRGLLVAEIQQSSNVTYRLFDWNRVGTDGKPRPLHVREGLDVVDFACGPVLPQHPQPTGRAGVSRLVDCDKFSLDRLEIDQPTAVGGDRRCHILCVLEGSVRLDGDPMPSPLSRGSVALLSASIGSVRVEPRGKAVLLDAYLP